MMTQLRLGLTFSIIAMSIIGCSSFKNSNGFNRFNNHSLDYKNTTTLAPLELPTDINNPRDFTPIYPAPTVEQLAIDHAPKLENKEGTRFALPRPEPVIVTPNDTVTHTVIPLGKPELIVDGNKNPLLQISGSTDEIWQYTVATLSSLNLKIIEENRSTYQVTVEIDQKNYVVKLNAIGNLHNLALFNSDSTFADPKVAKQLLTQIYENWPA